MSEAKPQDGSTVKGYRTLSHGELGKMNQFKELSRQFIQLLPGHAGDIRPSNDQDWEIVEWIRKAEMDMKVACMSACRSVSRPDADC